MAIKVCFFKFNVNFQSCYTLPKVFPMRPLLYSNKKRMNKDNRSFGNLCQRHSYMTSNL